MAKVGTSSMIFILFLCLLPGVFLGVLETGNKSTHAVLTINTLLWEESEGSFRDSALPDSLFFFLIVLDLLQRSRPVLCDRNAFSSAMQQTLFLSKESTIVRIYNVTSQLLAKQLVNEQVTVKHEKATNNQHRIHFLKPRSKRRWRVRCWLRPSHMHFLSRGSTDTDAQHSRTSIC